VASSIHSLFASDAKIFLSSIPAADRAAALVHASDDPDSGYVLGVVYHRPRWVDVYAHITAVLSAVLAGVEPELHDLTHWQAVVARAVGAIAYAVMDEKRLIPVKDQPILQRAIAKAVAAQVHGMPVLTAVPAPHAAPRWLESVMGAMRAHGPIDSVAEATVLRHIALADHGAAYKDALKARDRAQKARRDWLLTQTEEILLAQEHLHEMSALLDLHETKPLPTPDRKWMKIGKTSWCKAPAPRATAVQLAKAALAAGAVPREPARADDDVRSVLWENAQRGRDAVRMLRAAC
jgi:hypothetical protein